MRQLNTTVLSNIVKGLDGFKFTVNEYVCGDESVGKKSKAHIRKRFRIPEKSLNLYLPMVLRAKAIALAESTARWASLPSAKSPIITLNIGEESFKGTCTFSPKSVRVELPFEGRKLCRESAIIRGSDRVYMKGERPNRHGVECAKNLMLKLYFDVLYMRD